jgi:hypothetical protein
VRDVGQYLVVRDLGFAGSYEILQVLEDLETVLLARFPPREARGYVAPVVLINTELPPILYRRTVAFVLMDRLLKYHALRIRINAPELFTAEFVHDALSLLREAKPSGSFVYLEPVTDFNEVLHLREKFELSYGPWVEELFSYEPFPLRAGTEMRVGEFFAYFDQAYAVVLPWRAVHLHRDPRPAVRAGPDEAHVRALPDGHLRRKAPDRGHQLHGELHHGRDHDSRVRRRVGHPRRHHSRAAGAEPVA